MDASTSASPQQRSDVRLTVRDSGIGLDPDVAAHLFERFRQGDSSTTRQYGGLGVGLGIVRHVVELHGGIVTASSGGENTGSTFEVRLPNRLMEAPAAEPAPAAPPSPTLSGVSVLAVDDDPRALDFVRTTLERHGASRHDGVVARGGEGAVQARAA